MLVTCELLPLLPPSWSPHPVPVIPIPHLQSRSNSGAAERRADEDAHDTGLSPPSRSVLPCPGAHPCPGWDVAQPLRSRWSQLLSPSITNPELLPRVASFYLLYPPHLMDLEPFLPNSLQHFPVFMCRDFIGHHFHVSKISFLPDL